MKSNVLLRLSVIAALALALVGCGAFASPYTFHGSVIDPPAPAADFALTDQSGQPFRLSEQTGKVALLFFGYTFCPDACPATLTQFQKIRAGLGDDAERVRFVLVTVDPERDTPERLRAYLSSFDAAFVGLTGPLTDMETVWQSYGVFREKAAAGAAAPSGGHVHADDNYLIDHTTRIYAVDARGNLRVTYTIDADANDLVQDVRQLLGGN